MKQLIIENKIRQIEYTSSSSYAESNNVLPISGKIILADPKYINSGSILLPKNQSDYTLVRSYACSYITVTSKSNNPFHLKIILDDDQNALNSANVNVAFGITTSVFSYCNPTLPIIIAIANGSLEIDETDGHLISIPTSFDQEVEFVIAAYEIDTPSQYSNFGAYSIISSGTF
jgi:hypothetical protein